ncbi:hypothetical protein [Marinicella rhabdoformis]|uniref:hypothetical protein n=1 Tax=Marinicella rhabdoformis TaxID=2580566 RepID=UPI0012AED538|nr:hypothetical protein [Marinicella rhabdoformis]
MKDILSVLLFLSLLACGSATEDSQAKQVNKVHANKVQANKGKDQKTHMLSEHERALQKAKEVEKELKKADDKRRKIIDDNG